MVERFKGVVVAVVAATSVMAGTAYATTTPIAGATTAIDFTDILTDITAFFVALLGVKLVSIAFGMAFRWLKRGLA